MLCKWFREVLEALGEQSAGFSAEHVRVRHSERGLGLKGWSDSVGPACDGWHCAERSCWPGGPFESSQAWVGHSRECFRSITLPAVWISFRVLRDWSWGDEGGNCWSVTEIWTKETEQSNGPRQTSWGGRDQQAWEAGQPWEWRWGTVCAAAAWIPSLEHQWPSSF